MNIDKINCKDCINYWKNSELNLMCGIKNDGCIYQGLLKAANRNLKVSELNFIHGTLCFICAKIIEVVLTIKDFLTKKQKKNNKQTKRKSEFKFIGSSCMISVTRLNHPSLAESCSAITTIKVFQAWTNCE